MLTFFYSTHPPFQHTQRYQITKTIPLHQVEDGFLFFSQGFSSHVVVLMFLVFSAFTYGSLIRDLNPLYILIQISVKLLCGRLPYIEFYEIVNHFVNKTTFWWCQTNPVRNEQTAHNRKFLRVSNWNNATELITYSNCSFSVARPQTLETMMIKKIFIGKLNLYVTALCL